MTPSDVEKRWEEILLLPREKKDAAKLKLIEEIERGVYDG